MSLDSARPHDVADPGPCRAGPDDLRRQGSRHCVSPSIEPPLPPEGAPNVLIVLLDDVGFGVVEHNRRTVRHADRRAAGSRVG